MAKRTNTSDKAIGRRVKERRIALQIGQADIGIIIGKSVGMVSRFENGEYPLTTSHLVKLAERFGCTVDDLVYGDKGKK